MKISFIIATWNCRRQIENCLRTLQALPIPDREIIVVDAGSHDGTKEFLEIQTGIRFIPLTVKMSWSFNNQIGMAHSTGDWFCIMNPDVYFNESFHFLNEICEEFSSYPIPPILAPQLVYPNWMPQYSMRNLNFVRIFGMFTLTGQILDRTIGRRFSWWTFRVERKLEEVGGYRTWRVEHPIGSMFLVHSRTLKHYGGHLWREGFRFGAADSDMFKMAEALNVDVFITPMTQLVHEHGHSLAKRPRREAEQEFTYGFVLFCRYWKDHPVLLSLFYILDSVISIPLAVLGKRLSSFQFARPTRALSPSELVRISSARISGLLYAWSVRLQRMRVERLQ